MTRDDFMKEARETTQAILQGKENGIMNLVQRAWAEGKRNAEVETLRAAIYEALDRREPKEQPVDWDEAKGMYGDKLQLFLEDLRCTD